VLAEADWPAGSTISAGWRPPRPQERIPVVVGIGLNVVWPKPRHPPGPGAGGTGPIDAATAPGPAGAEDGLAELADTATALSWLGARVDRVDLLVGFLRRLEARYGELVGGGAAGVLAAWRRRSATLGRRVRVEVGSDDVEGTAVDVTDEGLLVVDTLAGDRRTLAVGDVVHLRPA
jgi:biotin-(acetyl-CoA carboxylase) ligase